MNITININRRSAIAIACIAMVCAVTSASALDAVTPKVPGLSAAQPQPAQSGAPAPAVAQPQPQPAPSSQPIPTETGLKAKPLTTRTKASPGLAAGEGRVLFPYGQSQPTVTCAPLHICVVTLMPGEKINDLSIGDSVQTSQAGESPIVIIKPTEAGLGTNLVISTNRQRVYYLILESSDTKYQPQVGFYDAAEMTAHFTRSEDEELSRSLAPGKIDPSSLDFNYSCESSGGDDFMPSRVFSGNGHLYLQMPNSMKGGDAPAIFNLSSGSTELINSRFDPTKGYFVVDGTPSKLKLVVGNKDGNRSVTCSRSSK
jgi:type IV secretion system protein TrbG